MHAWLGNLNCHGFDSLPHEIIPGQAIVWKNFRFLVFTGVFPPNVCHKKLNLRRLNLQQILQQPYFTVILQYIFVYEIYNFERLSAANAPFCTNNKLSPLSLLFYFCLIPKMHRSDGAWIQKVPRAQGDLPILIYS